MPAKTKKASKSTMKVYPSVGHMVAAKGGPKAAIKYLVEAVNSLSIRLRSLELKVAIHGADTRNTQITNIMKVAPSGPPAISIRKTRDAQSRFRKMGKKK